MKQFRHELSDVQTTNIGENTKLWQFVIVLPGAIIGENCNICSCVFIENDVLIGNNVTIKSGVQLWDGITVKDNVFIGPNVTFTNDLIPRSKQYPEILTKTTIMEGASIGANATIIAGNDVGESALIGAGAVVTKNVGRNEVWIGNPARKVGYISTDNEMLDLNMKSKKTGLLYYFKDKELISHD